MSANKFVCAWAKESGDGSIQVCQKEPGAGRAYCPEHAEKVTTEVLTVSQQRKREPVNSGVMAYFPRTLRAISRVSFAGNEKHNPGQPLHWAKEKSTDHPDCVARHNLTPYTVDADSGERHVVHGAWRQLAWAEIALEAVEKGLCTWDDLEQGRVTIAELGPKLAK